VTGTGLSDEPSRSATRAALDLRPPGATTILDLDYRPMFWADPHRAGGELRAALPLVTVAVGNRAEVAVAVGTDDAAEAARRLLDHGVELAVVKMGGDGVLVATRERTVTVPPIRVEVVCGLGAGDAFGGSLVHGLLAGLPPEQAVRHANAAGAIVASRLACADAMPTPAEVEALLGRADAA
jgi:5-dehydro-2-deoxygluconokinase